MDYKNNPLETKKKYCFLKNIFENLNPQFEILKIEILINEIRKSKSVD